VVGGVVVGFVGVGVDVGGVVGGGGGGGVGGVEEEG